MMLHTGVPTIRNNILSYETRIMKTTVVRSAERVDELTIHFVFCIHARFTKMKKREIKKNNSFNTRRATFKQIWTGVNENTFSRQFSRRRIIVRVSTPRGFGRQSTAGPKYTRGDFSFLMIVAVAGMTTIRSTFIPRFRA